MKEKDNPSPDTKFAKTLREVSRSLASGMTVSELAADYINKGLSRN